MEKVLTEASCHQFHNLLSLSHGGHQVAVPTHGGVERNIVAMLVLGLKESGVEKNVGSCRLHPERILRAGELTHPHLGDLREVCKLAELLIVWVVVRGEDLIPVYGLQAEVAQDACQVDAGGVADLGPKLTSHCFMEI